MTKAKKVLNNVTLLGIDCVDIDRLILAASICQEKFQFAQVKLLTSLKSDHKDVVPIEPLDNIEKYSHFMIDRLETYVDTDFVLVFQYDGFILNPEAWSDEFLKYDYIGAPWLVQNWSVENFAFPKELLGTMQVGNGGFSLRSKKFLAACTELSRTGQIAKYDPEDVALCIWNRNLLESKGMKFAPVGVAKQFSFEAETDEHDVWDGQFGFHGFRWTDISKWTHMHPEYVVDAQGNKLIKRSL